MRGFKDVNWEVLKIELMAEHVGIDELPGVKMEDEQTNTEYNL